jgi:hypothetical protein
MPARKVVQTRRTATSTAQRSGRWKPAMISTRSMHFVIGLGVGVRLGLNPGSRSLAKVSGHIEGWSS